MRKPSLTNQERYLKIIEDTLKFYRKNPRAINENGRCSYIDGSGARCAVGRYISDEYIEALRTSRTIGQNVYGLHNEWGIDTLLVDKAQGLNLEFWHDLQNLHDNRANWNGMKLTTVGRERAKLIRTTWAPDLIKPKRNTRTKK